MRPRSWIWRQNAAPRVHRRARHVFNVGVQAVAANLLRRPSQVTDIASLQATLRAWPRRHPPSCPTLDYRMATHSQLQQRHPTRTPHAVSKTCQFLSASVPPPCERGSKVLGGSDRLNDRRPVRPQGPLRHAGSRSCSASSLARQRDNKRSCCRPRSLRRVRFTLPRRRATARRSRPRPRSEQGAQDGRRRLSRHPGPVGDQRPFLSNLHRVSARGPS